MSRRRSAGARLVVAAVVLGAAALAAVWSDRRASRDLLPGDAAYALEARGAGEVLERLERTRFAAAFAAGPTHAWLERSEAVRAVDEVRAAVGRATGVTPPRRALLEIVGGDAAVAWYPPPSTGAGRGGAVPWVAAGRLSLRAWPLAAVARTALRLGLAGGITRDAVAGRTVFTAGSGEDALRFFFTGRHIVFSAGRAPLGDATSRLGETAGWAEVFARLPEGGDLRVWARGGLLPAWVPGAADGTARAGGAVLFARSPVVVEAFLDAPTAAPPSDGGGAAPPVLPLPGAAPVLFHSSAGPVPPALASLVSDRARAVARLGGSPGSAMPALGRGFALAVTGVADGPLFPRPDGVLAIGMRDAAAARDAVRLLFPPGARAARGSWGTAFATRESLPLAGEFELWGAAAGTRLVLGTRLPLVEALVSSGQGRAAEPPGRVDDARPPDTVTAVNVAALVPPLRRYAPPLSGLLRARLRGAPDLARDFDLLRAVRSAALTTSTAPAGTSWHLTLDVGDLPAAP